MLVRRFVLLLCRASESFAATATRGLSPLIEAHSLESRIPCTLKFRGDTIILSGQDIATFRNASTLQYGTKRTLEDSNGRKGNCDLQGAGDASTRGNSLIWVTEGSKDTVIARPALLILLMLWIAF